jgi:hypothetical protein
MNCRTVLQNHVAVGRTPLDMRPGNGRSTLNSSRDIALHRVTGSCHSDIAPVHSMTSSVRPSSDAGTLTLIALAIFKLMIRIGGRLPFENAAGLIGHMAKRYRGSSIRLIIPRDAWIGSQSAGDEPYRALDVSTARRPCGSLVPKRRQPPDFRLTSTVLQPPMT